VHCEARHLPGRARLARELLGAASHVSGDSAACRAFQRNLGAGRRWNMVGVSMDRA
jgi:hypothetical protein